MARRGAGVAGARACRPDRPRARPRVGPRAVPGLEYARSPMRTYLTVRGGRTSEVAAEIVREQPLTVYVNGEKFLTLLCSPMMLEALVVGYLWMEKVIGGLEEIRTLDVSA